MKTRTLLFQAPRSEDQWC